MTNNDGAALLVRGLSKGYSEGGRTHAVLDDLSFEVRAGERVAILGRSGSGKSTLLNLISGIDLPDAGSVVVGGQDLTALSELERTLFRRHHIGFVFQFFNLIPTLTVLENLLLPLELAGKDGKRSGERALSLLDSVGLGDRGDSSPDRLSGGEQQRVAIARALIHEPTLLLADEPTGNLDAETGERVARLLEDLTEKAGTTVIVVTHAQDMADRAERVLRLGRGRITVEREAARS